MQGQALRLFTPDARYSVALQIAESVRIEEALANGYPKVRTSKCPVSHVRLEFPKLRSSLPKVP